MLDNTSLNITDNNKLMESHRNMRRTKEGRQQLAEMGLSSDGHKELKGRMNYPFCSWDGEGTTICSQCKSFRWNQDYARCMDCLHKKSEHHYILFGSSNGDQVSDPSLSTNKCLDLLITSKQKYPKVINVGFALGYDVEMILRDLPLESMRRLYDSDKNVVWWGPYRIHYIRGKFLQVTYEAPNGKRTTVRLWDVFSFFRTSFVNTIESYLGSVPNLEEIKLGKASRQMFRFDELEEKIIPYWKLELKYLVILMEKLRNLFLEAGLKIIHWHGPGALANYLFTQNYITSHMNRNLSEEILIASQYAFAAGRFEPFRIGRTQKTIYKYDINSAHPATIAKLPSLNNCNWIHITNSNDALKCANEGKFGLYHIEYNALQNNKERDIMLTPHPFYYRDKRSCVHFPCAINSWRWTPEITIALSTIKFINAVFFIIEAWILEDNGTRPFEWIYEKYDQRLIWKKCNNQAQYALKLALNSLFGKMAQKVGWHPGPNGKLPRYHQLEWAGYITSGTRAILWNAIWEAHTKNGLIGCETDSVMSLEPLESLPISEKIGEWDLEIWDDLIYLQNGIYFYHDKNGWHHKFRGLDNDSVTVDDVLRFLEKLDLREPYKIDGSTLNGPLCGTTSRFIGSKLAMRTQTSRRCTWETNIHLIHLGSQDGKRCHDPNYCVYCQDEYIPPSEVMHTLRVTQPIGFRDYPHMLPWRNNIQGQETPPLLSLYDEDIPMIR